MMDETEVQYENLDTKALRRVRDDMRSLYAASLALLNSEIEGLQIHARETLDYLEEHIAYASKLLRQRHD